MSFNTIATMAQDFDLQQRIIACATMEGKPEPAVWVSTRMWELAATPGWAAAYASALATHVSLPGKREAVITDGMILSAVQPMD